MRNKNLNIPATLVRTVKGKKYSLDGTLVAINENAMSCTMKFGNVVKENIPTKQVFLNEGFVDSLKDLGKRAWRGIKGFLKVLGGFLVPVDEKGDAHYEFINNPTNLVGMKLPEGVNFAPSDNLLNIAKEAGMRLKNTLTSSDIWKKMEDVEDKIVNTYWTRVMHVYAKNESMNLVQAVRFVNENYYRQLVSMKTLNEVNTIHAKAGVLNESNYSLFNTKDYGMICPASEVRSRICQNMFGQLTNTRILNVKGMETSYSTYDKTFGVTQNEEGVDNDIDENTLDKIRETRLELEKRNKELLKSHEDDGENIYDPFRNMTTKEIADYIKRPKATFPILVWGAPGIGKTAILKRSNEDLNKLLGYNLNLVQVMCSHLQADTFALPGTLQNAADQKIVESLPKTWLPVFNPDACANDEAIIETNRMYNAGKYKLRIMGKDVEMSQKDVVKAYNDKNIDTRNRRSDEDSDYARYEKNKRNDYNDTNKSNMLINVANNGDNTQEYNGGVLFFDEFDRAKQSQSKSILMALCSDRIFETNVLASNWAICCASNRAEDDKLSAEKLRENRQSWTTAALQRFTHITYVPTIPEWLEWARSANEDGRQHVDEKLCSFVEMAPPYVFYSALDLYTDDYKAEDDAYGTDTAFDATVNKITKGRQEAMLRYLQGDMGALEELNNYVIDTNDANYTTALKLRAFEDKTGNWSMRSMADKINPQITDALKEVFHATFKDDPNKTVWIQDEKTGELVKRYKEDVLYGYCYSTIERESDDMEFDPTTGESNYIIKKADTVDDEMVYYVLQGLYPTFIEDGDKSKPLTIEQMWYGLKDDNGKINDSNEVRLRLDKAWHDWITQHYNTIYKEYPVTKGLMSNAEAGKDWDSDVAKDNKILRKKRIDEWQKPANRLTVLNAFLKAVYKAEWGDKQGINKLYKMHDDVFKSFSPTELANIIKTGYASWEEKDGKSCVEYGLKTNSSGKIVKGRANIPNTLKVNVGGQETEKQNPDIWKTNRVYIQKICKMLLETLYRGVNGWSMNFDTQVKQDFANVINELPKTSLTISGRKATKVTPADLDNINVVFKKKTNKYCQNADDIISTLSAKELETFNKIKDNYTIRMHSYDEKTGKVSKDLSKNYETLFNKETSRFLAMHDSSEHTGDGDTADRLMNMLVIYDKSVIAKSLLNITFFILRQSLSVSRATDLPIYCNMIWGDKWADFALSHYNLYNLEALSLDQLMGDFVYTLFKSGFVAAGVAAQDFANSLMPTNRNFEDLKNMKTELASAAEDASESNKQDELDNTKTQVLSGELIY